MKMTMMWVTLREKRDADSAYRTLYKRHRDLIAVHIPCVDANQDDSRDVHPINTEVDFVSNQKALTDTSSQYMTKHPKSYSCDR